jgi:hypothetical protein
MTKKMNLAKVLTLSLLLAGMNTIKDGIIDLEQRRYYRLDLGRMDKWQV